MIFDALYESAQRGELMLIDRFAQIAIEAGMTYGAQMPGTVYFRPEFADQDWKKPNRTAYMAALAQHRPRMATVLDWERDEQLPEVLEWAEEAAQYVEVVIIIPKVFGGIPRIPRRIGGREVVLGYSVPTKYGGTELPLWEFAGWPVHLLGGSPHRQLHAAHYVRVNSADGNYMNLKASRFCEYWAGGRWISLHPKQPDAIYEAFRRSCANVMAAWKAASGTLTPAATWGAATVEAVATWEAGRLAPAP